MPSASTRISTSHTTSTRRFSQRPSSSAGRVRHAISALKNDCRTRGQPGELVTASTATAANTTVEAKATSTDRRERERR